MSGFDYKHLTNPDNLVRLGYVAVLFFAFKFIYFTLAALFLIGLGTLVVNGATNDQARNFARSFSSFIYQICLFITFNSDIKPFPFDSWPKE